ncbi:hypothetical protein [Candidatus Binatus sp.]|uniref:hypothetical protein n=1 Tax=Candidatus Binatus sp. TaxID=2811406 RepID=UPI003CC5FA3C
MPEVDKIVDDPDSLPTVPSKGQPIKLTAKVSQVICDAVRVGSYFSVACRAAGISMDTFARWKKRGAAGEEPFATFLQDLQQAQDDHELAAVKAIHAAGADDWRAHLAILERRHPEKWSRARERSLGDDAGRGLQGNFLNIILNLGGPDDWPERHEIPEVSEGTARAIESDAPGTKV